MKNLPASIRAKLMNISRNEDIGFQTIVIRYFHERFLYRLSISDYKENLILKGGGLLYHYNRLKSRQTLDIDFLGKNVDSDISFIKKIFSEIVKTDSPSDGVVFDYASLTSEPINEQSNYSGVRIHINAKLGQIKNMLQFDVGFGDIVSPNPVLLGYPVLLDQSAVPELYAYTIESVIAEKFQTMIELSASNSRLKDFYDVYKLIKTGNVNDVELEQAIHLTFKNRSTNYQENHLLFDKSFVDSNKLKQWSYFLNKAKIREKLEFTDVWSEVIDYLLPFWDKLKEN